MASSSVDLGVWKILPIFAIVTITSTSKKFPVYGLSFPFTKQEQPFILLLLFCIVFQIH